MFDDFAYCAAASGYGSYIVRVLAQFFDGICDGDAEPSAFDKRQIKQVVTNVCDLRSVE